MHLTVIHPFGREEKAEGEEKPRLVEYVRGDKIVDDGVIKLILASENASHVVKTAD